MPRAVGSRRLKTHLGTYLRMVRSGATFVVTDRGRPVASLGPVRVSGHDVAGRLAEMAARGEVTLPATGRLPRIRRARVTGRPVSETLLADREDRV